MYEKLSLVDTRECYPLTMSLSDDDIDYREYVSDKNHDSLDGVMGKDDVNISSGYFRAIEL